MVYFSCRLSWQRYVSISVLVAIGLIQFDVLRSQTLKNSEELPANQVRGIRIPEGFEISLVATDQLATNIYSMVVDEAGRPLVSGPGYIKRLEDKDGDGAYESTTLVLNGPRTGAQGMLFESGDLYFVGDGGLFRYRAGRPPEKLLDVSTGAEHTAHALRRGPDGWLYLIAGNATKIPADFYNSPSSPIKNPQQGFIMRIHPDNHLREIVAHGFRNPYDFDFNSDGQIFAYDSDGERQVSLPWYRPTRLFQVRPGDDAGFVTPNWKRPSYFFDMPIQVGELGRGSPTGVECYRAEKLNLDLGNQNRFPIEYENAVFTADWTFGRVHVFKRNENGSYDDGSPFAIATGQTGFAVTDLAVTPDGSLLISVGGRGTQGGIYRVRPTADTESDSKSWVPTGRLGLLADGRSWDELTKDIDDTALVGALTRGTVGNDGAERLLERYVGDPEFYQRVLNSDSLKEAFLQGSKWLESEDEGAARIWFRLLRAAPDELIQICARGIETTESSRRNPTVPSLTVNSAPFVSRTIAGLLLAEKESGRLEKELTKFHVTGRQFQELESHHHMRLLRAIQLSIGGARPARSTSGMFHGYVAGKPVSREVLTKLVDEFENWKECLPADSPDVLVEFGRTVAMLRLESPELRQFMIDQFSDNQVVGDIHWLNCLACVPGTLTPDQAKVVAAKLVSLRPRLKSQGLNEDRFWVPRVTDMAKLMMGEKGLGDYVGKNSELSTPGNEFLFSLIPSRVTRESALTRFAKKLAAADPRDVNAAQVQLLSMSKDSELTSSLLRKLGDQPHLRAAVVVALGNRVSNSDSKLLIRAMRDVDAETWRRAATMLQRLAPASDGVDVVLALKNLQSLGSDRRDVQIKDSLVRLIEARLEWESNYQFKQTGDRQLVAIEELAQQVQKRFPDSYAAEMSNRFDSSRLLERLAKIDWTSGDAARGKLVFARQNCVKCHEGGNRLGPQLNGIYGRFKRHDVFQAIVNPNDQVPERYRAVTIETVDGMIVQGTVIYESVDGITLSDSSGNTVRINKSEIETRQKSRQSVMPSGLLDNASDQDWADLEAYLKTL